MRTNSEEAQHAFAELHKLHSRLCAPVKLLLVEDSDADAIQTQWQLKSYNVVVDVGMSARQACELAGKFHYDLCLLDLKLFDTDGLTLLLHLKKTGFTAPIVVLTGLDDESPSVREALRLGAVAAVPKPLTQEHVKVILGTARP